MNTGEKIKKIRKMQGLTQRELANKLGTSPQNLAQYENNKRNPKYWTLQKIAEVLNVNIEALLPDSDYNNALGDKAALAYCAILEQIIGLKGYTFNITEDTDELYINYPDGILKIDTKATDRLLEEIESFTDFKMQELKKKYANNFIPKKFFDYASHTIKPEYQADINDYLRVNAAHERTDIEVTDEMKKHDDDIMNDENF